MEKSLAGISHLTSEQKLVPPPSPPAMLLAQSSGLEPGTLICENTNSLMNPPPHPPPFFQNQPSQKGKSVFKGEFLSCILKNSKK